MIIQNAIKTPDGTILVSSHVHDCVQYTDRKGLTYMVDGGLEYLKRGGEQYEDLSCTDDEPFELVRTKYVWGTYGKTGVEPLSWVYLCDMELAHIDAVLKSCTISPVRGDLLKKELQYRVKRLIKVKNH